MVALSNGLSGCGIPSLHLPSLIQVVFVLPFCRLGSSKALAVAQEVWNTLKKGLLEAVSDQPPVFHSCLFLMERATEVEVNKMLQKGALELVHHPGPCFYSWLVGGADL